MKSKVLLIKADEKPMEVGKKLMSNQIYKNPHLVIEDRNLGLLDCDSIRIQMNYVGICGSDIHLLKSNSETGYICTSVPVKIPKDGRIIGHEGVGLVLDVGSNVKNIKKGMYVTLESIIVCNNCDVCKRGDFNQCRNAKLMGLEVDGIMGNIVDVNSNLAHDVTSYIKKEDDLIAMACVEPAGVAYDACENAKIKPGDTVVVFGGGPIGLYTVMLSKLIFGASKVHVVEPIEFRRSLLREWTEYVYDTIDSLKNNLKICDAIIETSGDLQNVNKSLNSVDANGTVVLLARSGDPLFIEKVDHIITNNISVVGSRGHLCGAFDRILKMNESKRIELGSSITSVVNGLENLKKILESKDIEKDNCKIVVRLNDLEN